MSKHLIICFIMNFWVFTSSAQAGYPNTDFNVFGELQFGYNGGDDDLVQITNTSEGILALCRYDTLVAMNLNKGFVLVGIGLNGRMNKDFGYAGVMRRTVDSINQEPYAMAVGKDG